MRIPLRAARRLAVTGWFALAGLLLVVAQGRAATPPEKMLPDSTVAFVKMQNAAALREAFRQSQIGQLWNDPAVKAWKDDILDRVDADSKTLKEKIGVTYRELFELPQGPTAIAFLKHSQPADPDRAPGHRRRRQEHREDDRGPDQGDQAGRDQRRQGLDGDLQGRDDPRDPAPEGQGQGQGARTRRTSPSRRSSGRTRGASSTSAATSTP